MRTNVDAATLALYLSGEFDLHTRLKVENGSGTFINLNGLYIAYELKLPEPNAPIGSLHVDFIRETTKEGLASSLSPTVFVSDFNKLDDGVTYSPLLQLGRLVTFEIALTSIDGARPADASSLWYEVFKGYITEVDWPVIDSRKAAISCNGLAGVLQIAKSEAEYTYTAGTSLETVARQILDNNGFPTVPINFPQATGKVLPNDYAPGLQKTVWSQLWDLAQSMGWIVYYRYDGHDPAELTFFAPAREKVVPDMEIDAYDFQALAINEEEVRNVGYLVYFDENSLQDMVGPFVDNASIAKYGGSLGIRRPFWINLELESPIRSLASATDMLNAALSDVADPDAIAAALTFPLVFGESGVDLYEFTAREELFDSNQTFAPFSINISEGPNSAAVSVVNVRGVPTAGAQTWAGEGQEPVEPLPESETQLDLEIKDVKEIDRDEVLNLATLEYGIGEDVKLVSLSTGLVALPLVEDPWPKPDPVTGKIVLPAGWQQGYRSIASDFDYATRLTKELGLPASEEARLVMITGHTLNSEVHGEPEKFIIWGDQAREKPIIQDFNTFTGATYPKRDVYFNIVDPQAPGTGGTLYAWVNKNSDGNADSTAAPDGSVAIPTTPYNVGPGLLFGAAGSLLDEVTFKPGQTKLVHFQYISADGRDSGVYTFPVSGGITAIDNLGEVAAGSIYNAMQIAADMRPPYVGPIEPADHNLWPTWFDTSVDPPVLKRWSDAANDYVSTVPAIDIIGQIDTTQIANEAITAAKIGAEAVVAGKIAANAVTEAEIAALSITTAKIADEAITAVQLANAAVTSAKIAVGAVDAAAIGAAAVTTAKLATGAVTEAILAAGAVTETKITNDSITTPKIVAGAITTVKVAADAITANEIAALTITAAEIAAGAIVTAKIAAGAVTATEIAALTITSAKIAAGAIIAEKIAAGAVIAEKIGASAVTTAKLDALAVTAVKIAADAIETDKIAAFAVTAAEIAAGSITTAKIAAGAVTAGEIASLAITTDKLAANAVTAAKIDAFTITATQIASNAITAIKISAGAIEAGKIAAGAVTATAIAANAVTATAILAGEINATHINVVSLAAISVNTGVLSAGLLQNAAASPVAAIRLSGGYTIPGTVTKYIDLAATGSTPFIFHPALTLKADGDAVFAGEVASSSFTATIAAFSGEIRIGNVRMWLNLGVLNFDLTFGGTGDIALDVNSGRIFATTIDCNDIIYDGSTVAVESGTGYLYIP